MDTALEEFEMNQGPPSCPVCSTLEIKTEKKDACKCLYKDLTCKNGHSFYDNLRGGYTLGRVHPQSDIGLFPIFLLLIGIILIIIIKRVF